MTRLVRSLLWLTLAAAASLVATGPASATPDCTARTAVQAGIEQLTAPHSPFIGRCVIVRGLLHGGTLYPSLDGYYKAGPLVGGDPEAEPNDRYRIFLDNTDSAGPLPRNGFHEAVAVGRAQDCEQMRRSISRGAGDDIVMIAGPCHYASGPIIWLKSVRVVRNLKPVRLMGESARARVGTLSPAPPDWRYRAFVEALARQYLAALRGGDREAFLKLHLAKERPIGDGEAAAALAFGNHPGFARLRRSRGRSETAFLLEHPAGRPNDRRDDEGYAAWICFCTAAGCEGRWPISGIDADNRPERPYVCTKLDPFQLFRAGVEPAFWTERGRWGLDEPRAGK